MKQTNLISAFTPPPNGFISAKDGKIFLQDFRTKERYLEYKNCGFDEMIFAGETKYIGENYQSSELKMMLDLCEECGLKAIVFDERIISITVKSKNHIIGELFDTEEKLHSYIQKCIQEYSKHPAFYGVSIIDEPFIGKKGVVQEIAQAFKRVAPQVFVHTCFTPLMPIFGGPVMQEAFGLPEGREWEAYANYVDAMSFPELGYWGFDSYPFKYWEGICAIV